VEDSISGECVVVVVVPPDAGVDAEPDTVVPTVISTSPPDLAPEVGTAITITATFSEPLDPASATGAVAVSAGEAVPGTVSVDGAIVSFVPAAPLTPNVQHSVTINTSVTDLAGNALANNHTWTFTTRAGGWTPPTTIESDTTKGAGELAAGANTAGDAVAAWVMRDCSGTTCNGQPDIWVSVYNGTWSAPTVLVTADIAVSGLDVAVDGSGNAFLVWNENIGSVGSVRWSRYTAGGTWTAPALLESDDTGNTSRPRVTVDPAGNAMAVWEQKFGGITAPSDLMWSRFAAGGTTWTTPAPVEAATDGQGKIELAAAPDGSVVAIWEPASAVRAAKFVPGTGWGASVQLKASSLGQGVVQAASDSTFVVIYRTGSEVWTARLTSTWSTATAIDSSADATASGVEFALSSDNTGLALWSQGAAGAQDLWHGRFEAASGFDTATRIEQLAGASTAPSVAFGPAGTAMAVWVQTAASIGSIQSNTYSETTAWSTPQLVETSDTGNASPPTVFYDPADNKFVTVWAQNVTGYHSVYTSSFE
nr:Ig-like domain-containing protein [Deltaproteobacteria bacterium]